jgi:cell division septation protein DedD
MDWLRRNWPDLLIGLALIAVIAGIVATLLTGGSFFPLGGGSGPTVAPPPAPTAPVDPPPPGDGEPAAGATDEGPSVAVLPPSDQEAEGDDLPPGAPPPDAEADADGPAPSVAPVSPDATAPSDPAPSEAATDAPPPAAAAPAAEPEPAPAAPSPTPAPAAGDGLPTEPYRVSVGAFTSRENAQTQAARFREAGYPVFLGTQDELTLVLVGPYGDAARARSVADEIREGPYGIDPVVYEFRPDAEAAGAAAQPDAPAPAPQPAPAEPAEDAAPQADATASDTVLQVGAYADRDGAAPQIERLSGLGFEVETIREDGLLKLLIGPLSGPALEDARVILDGAGVEYFAR